MPVKDTAKQFKRLLARQSLYLCSLTVKFLPRSWLYAFANFAALLGYYLAVKQRRIAYENLGNAFGQKISHQDKTKIAQDCFRNIAKSGVELLYVLEAPRLSKELVFIQGKQHLDKALDRGKGVIVVSAHFGNFPLALTRLSQEGYEVSVILRRMRDDKVEDFLAKRRQMVGIHFIHSTPRQACVENSIRALRNKGILFIQLDQNFGTAGVFVNFFGQQAATATGPVVLALRTQAAILPLFIVRQADNSHKLIIEPEFIIQERATQEETLQYNIQKITSVIESYISRYPQEWGWIHRRWKSRPAA